MNGNLMLEGNNVIFSYENNVLNIYCPNGEAKKFLFKDDPKTGHRVQHRSPLPKKLLGFDFDDKCPVYFEIFPNGYGFKSDLLANNVVLKPNVKRYTLTIPYKTNKYQIVLSSKQYYKFLDVVPFYELNFKKSINIGTAKINKEYLKHNAHIVYKKYNIEIKVGPYIRANAELDITPQIVLIFDKKPLESDVFEIIDYFLNIISFLFMRTNIYPDSIEYYSDNSKTDIIYCLPVNYVKEKENINSFQTVGSIRWRFIFKYIQPMLDDIIAKNLSFYYLDAKSTDRLWVDFDKASRDSAFFEGTFDLIYGKYTKSLSKIDGEFVSLLNDFALGKNKRYRKRAEYLSNNLVHVSLCEKMIKAFNDNDASLKRVKKEFSLEKKTSEEIAAICSENRNSIDHGRKKDKISEETASAFAFLRLATYAMWLKRWGFDEDTISVCLLELYKIKR